jgi:hypothetical protein
MHELKEKLAKLRDEATEKITSDNMRGPEKEVSRMYLMGRVNTLIDVINLLP